MSGSSAGAPLQSVDFGSGPARPRGYLFYAIGLAVFSLCLGTLLALDSDPLPVGATLLLAALMVVAENRDRIFGDETSISSSIVVAIGSVVAFHESSPLLGPLICATCAGIYVPHIRNRSIAKSIINACIIGLSGFSAALVFELCSTSGDIGVLEVLILGTASVFAYWIVNSALLAIALVLLRGAPFGASIATLVRSETQLVPFAVAGSGVGLVFLSEGTWAGFAAMIVLLALVEIVWLSPPLLGHAKSRSVTVFATLRGALLCSIGVLVYMTVSGSVPVGIGAFCGLLLATSMVGLVLVGVRRRLGRWEVGLALGVVVAELPLIVLFAVGGAVAGVTEVWIGGLIIVVGLVAAMGARSLRRRNEHSLDPPIDDDLLVAAAVDLALLDTVEATDRPR